MPPLPLAEMLITGSYTTFVPFHQIRPLTQENKKAALVAAF